MTDSRYSSVIELAKQALRNGDRAEARRLVRQIVVQYPEGLEGLLILGGLLEPHESLIYLERAEKISPDDPRVKQALTWAYTRQKAASFAPNEEQTTRTGITLIPQQPAIEKRGLVWIWALMIILVLTLLFLVLGIIPRYPNQVSSHFNVYQSTKLSKITLTATPGLFLTEEAPQDSTSTEIINISPTPSSTPTPTNTPTPTPTPTIIPDLYGSAMEIRFISGPLDDYGTTFTMVDRDYFYDKGDKFETGKNTGVYYEELRYLILHSGYEDGSLTKPLEAEFIRKYLESWGTSGEEYILGQIEDLKGSQMIWIIDSSDVVGLELVDVIRLSHESSSQLWLEPQNLIQIIAERGGDSSEWIGEMSEGELPSVYLGFCGWGPSTITVDRSIYYRYILRFEIIT